MLHRQHYIHATAAAYLAFVVIGCSASGFEKTDRAEAAAVEELEVQSEADYTRFSSLVQDCEASRDTFFDCMVENVEPYFSRPPRSVRPALRELTHRVGSTCRRWLRAVLRGLETKQIFDATVYEDLDAAALACRRESLAESSQ
jgi:hypothetical protein